MKVYYVEAFSAEEYTDHTWVDSVYSTREKAEAYIEGMGKGPHGVDVPNYDYGYFLRQDCVEVEVQ